MDEYNFFNRRSGSERRSDYMPSDIQVLSDRLTKLENAVDSLTNTISGKDGLISTIAVLVDARKTSPTSKQLVFYSSVGGAISALAMLGLFKLM